MSLVVWCLFCAAATIVTGTGGAPAGKCMLGEDIFNILFNATNVDGKDYDIESAVGFAGDLETIRAAFKQPMENFTLADLEACLQLYKEPSTKPGKPSSSAASNFGYNRPDYLGGVERLPVPVPDGKINYGHGYTTYQKPFQIEQKVKDYKPNPYMKAKSFQDIFLLIYNDFMKEWSSLFDGKLRPKYWNNYPKQAD